MNPHVFGQVMGSAACIATPRYHSAGWSEIGSCDVWERLETHEGYGSSSL